MILASSRISSHDLQYVVYCESCTFYFFQLNLENKENVAEEFSLIKVQS